MRFLRKKRYTLPLATLAIAGVSMWIQHPDFPIFPASDHYNPETRQFYNTPETRPVQIIGTIGSLWSMMVNSDAYRPASRFPMQTPDWQAFLAPSPQVKFIWFGHSTLLMRVNGKTVWLDPVYYRHASPIPIMMRRFQEPPATLAELPPIDLIVYTHAHYDHLDADVVDYFAKHSPQTRFLTPLGVGAYLRKWGIADNQIQEIDWHQSADYFGAKFHAVPARHDASRTLLDAKRSLWSGWVLETGSEKIYFSGDSSYAPHFQAIGQRFGGFDLAFVENGQYNRFWEDNHMFPHQTVQAVQDVQAKRWMPIHWGAYPLAVHAWDEPVRESTRISAEKGLPMLTPVMGQVFDKNTVTGAWWEGVK